MKMAHKLTAESFFHTKYCQILFANEKNSTKEAGTQPPSNGTAISDTGVDSLDTEVIQLPNSKTLMEETVPSPPGVRYKLAHKIASILASWIFVSGVVSLIYMGTYNHVSGVGTFINWCPR